MPERPRNRLARVQLVHEGLHRTDHAQCRVIGPGAGNGRALQRYAECELRQTDRAGEGIGAQEGLLERRIEVVVQPRRRRGRERRAVERVGMDDDDLQPCETSNTNDLTRRRDPSWRMPRLLVRRLDRPETGKQIVGARSAPRGSWPQSARKSAGTASTVTRSRCSGMAGEVA